MGDTAIGWTDKTWNPVVGCERVSPGCKNCYAMADHDRRHKIHIANGGRWSNAPGAKDIPPQYAHPFEWRPDGPGTPVLVQLFPGRLTQPDHWKQPAMVFVNSVSDLFHSSVPFDFIDEVYDVMSRNRRHIFQVLTKRPERMEEYLVHHRHHAPPNVWHGASLEGTLYAGRLDYLRRIGSRFDVITFVSAEPMVLPYESERLSFSGINWVIAGWESGHNARPWARIWREYPHDDWQSRIKRNARIGDERERMIEQTRIIRDAALADEAAFFLKQYSDPSSGKKIPEPELDGRQWLEWPQTRRCVGCKAVFPVEHADINRCSSIREQDGGPAEPCGEYVCCECAEVHAVELCERRLCPAHAARFWELKTATAPTGGLW